MNNIYYDLYYAVNKNRDQKQKDDNDDNINDYMFDIISIPNISRRNGVILRERKMGTQITYFKLFMLYRKKRKNENSRRCDICNIDVPRASFAKHLRSKKQLKNEKQIEVIKQE